MPLTLDFSEDFEVWDFTESVNFYSRTDESPVTYASADAVANALREVEGGTDATPGGAMLFRQTTAFHVSATQLSTAPKQGDAVRDADLRVYVVQDGVEYDDPTQLYRLPVQLATGSPGTPAAPTNLTATAGSRQVALTWDASPGATSYTLKRGTVSGGPYTTVYTGSTASFTDTGLTNGTTYYYVVTASSIGTSSNSSQASATPQFAPGDITGLSPSVQVALMRSLGLLWQNTGKTVPASSHGDRVRVATCPFTGSDFVAPSDAARPTLTSEGGGKWSLLFDGVDDEMSVAAYSAEPSGGFALWAALVYTSGTTFGGIVTCNPNVSSLSNWIAPDTKPALFGPLGANSIAPANVTSAYVVALMDDGADLQSLRVNGALVDSDANAGASMTLTPITVGKRDTGQYAAMRLLAGGAYSAPPSGSEVTSLETYLAALLP